MDQLEQKGCPGSGQPLNALFLIKAIRGILLPSLSMTWRVDAFPSWAL
jgi:hypothetical protein